MGHSVEYRINEKIGEMAPEYIEKEVRKKAKASDAWRKIEEREMFKKLCHDIEFFDEHIEGSFEDYL